MKALNIAVVYILSGLFFLSQMYQAKKAPFDQRGLVCI